MVRWMWILEPGLCGSGMASWMGLLLDGWELPLVVGAACFGASAAIIPVDNESMTIPKLRYAVCASGGEDRVQLRSPQLKVFALFAAPHPVLRSLLHHSTTYSLAAYDFSGVIVKKRENWDHVCRRGRGGRRSQ